MTEQEAIDFWVSLHNGHKPTKVLNFP